MSLAFGSEWDEPSSPSTSDKVRDLERDLENANRLNKDLVKALDRIFQAADRFVPLSAITDLKSAIELARSTWTSAKRETRWL